MTTYQHLLSTVFSMDMLAYSFQDSFAVRAPLLGACDWCEATGKQAGRRRHDSEGRLKKCGGCSVVVYCSKSCQTAAWPTHKHICGSKSKKDAAVLGYPSTVSVARALNTWATMHTWSLGTIAEASAHCGQGVDSSLENQYALVFVLLSRDRAPGDLNNPAEAFILEQAGLVIKDAMPSLVAHWPRIERTCKALADDMRATLSAAERRAFAGFIPAAFHVKATGMVAFHQFPLFRLRAHGRGPSYAQPFVAEHDALCSKVAKIWGLLINDGLVLRPQHAKYGGPLLQAGRCMQLGKSWAWLPTEAEGEAEADAPVTGEAPRRTGSGLPPTATELYQRYHKLLGLRNFEFVTTRRQKLVLTVGLNGGPASVVATPGSTDGVVAIETENTNAEP